jgi:predicted nucleic acid-binding protein
LAWFFQEEETQAVLDVMRQVETDIAYVPSSLWKLEVANSLTVAVRRKRMDVKKRDICLDSLYQLNIQFDNGSQQHAWNNTLQLADQFDLTLYDATYLELAQRLVLPLASLDKDLRAAADALGISLLGV